MIKIILEDGIIGISKKAISEAIKETPGKRINEIFSDPKKLDSFVLNFIISEVRKGLLKDSEESVTKFNGYLKKLKEKIQITPKIVIRISQIMRNDTEKRDTWDLVDTIINENR
ncbi:MAG: hypothetical protein ABID38_04295 [Candidatus Diapherotrites archaeon]